MSLGRGRRINRRVRILLLPLRPFVWAGSLLQKGVIDPLIGDRLFQFQRKLGRKIRRAKSQHDRE